MTLHELTHFFCLSSMVLRGNNEGFVIKLDVFFPLTSSGMSVYKQMWVHSVKSPERRIFCPQQKCSTTPAPFIINAPHFIFFLKNKKKSIPSCRHLEPSQLFTLPEVTPHCQAPRAQSVCVCVQTSFLNITSHLKMKDRCDMQAAPTHTHLHTHHMSA